MSLKLHHLNCGSLCMMGGRLLSGKGSVLQRADMSCHCLLVESNDGLVLIDTGFAFEDCSHPRFPDTFLVKHAVGAKMDPAESALTQIQALGFSAADVRHIIVTHLDPEHAGGLMDFPHARVHVWERELEAALHPMTLWEKTRYRQYLWSHKPRWQTHQMAGEKWFGFETVQVLSDQLYDILLVPLLGHSRGHCGVAVSTDQGWLLHCGDAYYTSAEVAPEGSGKVPAGLHLLQAFDDVCRADRLFNQQRLRTLNAEQNGYVKLICSHDHDEFGRCQGTVHTLGKCRGF